MALSGESLGVETALDWGLVDDIDGPSSLDRAPRQQGG
jgi:enoyl-CoA hydratase/carnithine racemase